MKRIAIHSEDPRLRHRLALILRDRAEIVDIEEPCDLAIRCRDNKITVGEETLTVPFLHEELISLVDKYSRGERTLSLDAENRCAMLSGKSVRLTEVELRLLSAIMSGKGEFVSRERLLSKVWGDDVDPGIINVYIHYLREKLESSGEKIIISSRKSGYKIDGRYIVKC